MQSKTAKIIKMFIEEISTEASESVSSLFYSVFLTQHFSGLHDSQFLHETASLENNWELEQGVLSKSFNSMSLPCENRQSKF